jgi:hypothetical protein
MARRTKALLQSNMKDSATYRRSSQVKEGSLVYWHVLKAIKWALYPVFVLCAAVAIWDVARYGYVDIRLSVLAIVSLASLAVIAREERQNPQAPDDDT